MFCVNKAYPRKLHPTLTPYIEQSEGQEQRGEGKEFVCLVL